MVTLRKTCVAHAEVVEVTSALARLRIAYSVTTAGSKASTRWMVEATIDDNHPWSSDVAPD